MNSALRFMFLVIAKTLFSNATNQQNPFVSNKPPGTMIGFMLSFEFSTSLHVIPSSIITHKLSTMHLLLLSELMLQLQMLVKLSSTLKYSSII
jgi:hypothetical protein